MNKPEKDSPTYPARESTARHPQSLPRPAALGEVKHIFVRRAEGVQMSLLWTSTASSTPYMRIPSGSSACAGRRSLSFGNRMHANPGGAEGDDKEQSLGGVDTAATA